MDIYTLFFFAVLHFANNEYSQVMIIEICMTAEEI